MSLPIVSINLTVTNPGTPSNYLQSGAFISQGGTTLPAGSSALLTSLASLSSIISGVGNHTELVAMNNTYWAQGSNNGVYVLELGAPTIPANAGKEGAAALTTYITDNPHTFFLFLLPRSWDGIAEVITMVEAYDSPSSMVYFLATTTAINYPLWFASGGTPKAVLLLVEAPGIPITEFDLGAVLYIILNYNQTSASMVSPLCFSFVYGVTPYPALHNKTLLTQLKQAFVGYMTTGVEGGLSNTMLVWGLTGDGNQFNYWYSVAWTIINLDQSIANEVINGSNNGLAPLYYNDFGIKRLQNRCAKTLRSGVADGLILGNVIVTSLDPQTFAINVADGVYEGNAVINAVPFQTYLDANPLDYGIGTYAGLQVAITPQLGFLAIVINLNVSLFA